jgi:hypothetical protein
MPDGADSRESEEQSRGLAVTAGTEAEKSTTADSPKTLFTLQKTWF